MTYFVGRYVKGVKNSGNQDLISSEDEIIGQHFSVTQVEADLEAATRIVSNLLAGNSIPWRICTMRPTS